MKHGNKELMAEMLAAVYAKDKLEEIESLVRRSGADIKREDIERILKEDPDGCFDD